jgi:hypothetical protein
LRHFLITRFALPFPKDNPRYEAYSNNPGWFHRRCSLFEKHTLPSVKAQTFKDFTWILLANPEFPEISVSKLESYGIEVAWEDWEWDENRSQLASLLKNKVGDDWVISSRVDSDDILHNRFMEHTHFGAKREREWLAFPNGYVMDRDAAYLYRYINSPFVSLVEPTEEAKFVYHVSHIRARPRILSEVPGWIQVDHGGNVKNSVRRITRKRDCTKCKISDLRKDFTFK